jgi:hypothetical protein
MESIASVYIYEICGTSQPDLHRSALSILSSFIKGELHPDEACNQCHQCLGTDLPVKRMHSILTTSPIPLPLDPSCRRSVLEGRSRARPWTAIEDQRLLAGIARHGLPNWQLISSFVGNGRTRAQCAQRWTRGLDPTISKRPWTAAEDELLKGLAIADVAQSWRKIATKLGNRSDVQCRYRYQQLMKSIPRPEKPVEKNDPSPEPRPLKTIEEILELAFDQGEEIRGVQLTTEFFGVRQDSPAIPDVLSLF